MWLICGLGNPGEKYTNTRHNVGFDLLDQIAKEYKFDLIKKDKASEILKGNIDNKKCLLLKPLTFMNLSGNVVSKIKNYYKIPISNIIILHDDLDLKLGKVKIKIGGGNAGHKGLGNIDQKIGKEYIRLRIGINHPGSKKLVSSYVLKKFSKDDRKIIDMIMKILCNKLDLIFNDHGLLLSKLSLEIKKMRMDGI